MDFSINFKIDTRIRPRSSAGCNRLYNDDKGTGYFLLDFSDFEKLHRIYIHTNRWNLVGKSQLPPLVVHSTSKRPNIKFLISCCLTYIFTFGKKIPKFARDKYFRRIRNLWYQQYNAAIHRVEDLSSSRNTRTSTFFRFSFRKIVFYFGLYYPCHCGLPAPFVMSKKRYACHLHHETLDFFRNIRKVEGVIRPRTTWSKDLDKNHTKSITCYRSGITFKKDFSWYNGKFYKGYYDLERFRSTTKKQDAHFKRHEKYYKSRGGYIATFPHKMVPPPQSFREPVKKKNKKKKKKNNKNKKKKEEKKATTPLDKEQPEPLAQWILAAQAARLENEYSERRYEEITCPVCNILRCIRISKVDFFWPDFKTYDRYYYPTCVCGYTYKK